MGDEEQGQGEKDNLRLGNLNKPEIKNQEFKCGCSIDETIA
jgi:hypothetical protein